MSSLCRALRSLSALVGVGALAGGCGDGERPRPAAWPDPSVAAVGSASPTASAKAPPPEPWDLARALAGAKVLFPRAPSQHLGASVDGEILGDPSAKDYASLGPGKPLGVGATVLERHLDPGGTVFAMVKRAPGFDREGGDWEYLVLSGAGAVEQRGRLPLCARCHADAPHDHLFGGGGPRP